jgi:hypothetical protein
MSRCSAWLALVALALLLSPGCAASAAMPTSHTVAPCSWSYFGDPRAVVHSGSVYTGCIGTDGRTIVEAYDLATGRRDVSTLFEPLEADDHNNPSLVVFRDRVYAFSAPHSGYLYPRDRRPRMRYRELRMGTWGPVRTVPLGAGCGLGYTYPNPVVAGNRLYLFMRGPCWEPYFTSTRDGVSWAAPRTLVRSPSPSLQDGGGTRRVRPYAKYAATADGSIAMALATPAHSRARSTTCASRTGTSTAPTAVSRARLPTCHCASISSIASTATRPPGAARGPWTSHTTCVARR